MDLQLRAAARTHPGLQRTNNEDSAFVGHRLALVADGMGGAVGGEVASAIATHSVTYLDAALSRQQPVTTDLAAAAEFADHRLARAIRDSPALAGMGTTMTALLLHRDELAVLHIGDSRGYVYRDGALEQITRDHTYVQLLVDEGRITAEAAGEHPQRSVVTSVLQGRGDAMAADISTREAVVGERYLLCSDGLSDYVAHEDICAAMAQRGAAAATVERLIDLALQAGAPDNVTCIVADVLAVPTGGATPEQVLGAAAELGPLPLKDGDYTSDDNTQKTGG